DEAALNAILLVLCRQLTSCTGIGSSPHTAREISCPWSRSASSTDRSTTWTRSGPAQSVCRFPTDRSAAAAEQTQQRLRIPKPVPRQQAEAICDINNLPNCGQFRSRLNAPSRERSRTRQQPPH